MATLQEEESGAADQGAGEPGLLPAHHLVPGQDHLPPALELFLQLGSFLSLEVAEIEGQVMISESLAKQTLGLR